MESQDTGHINEQQERANEEEVEVNGFSNVDVVSNFSLILWVLESMYFYTANTTRT